MSELKDYLGKIVVVDTKTSYIYIGTLESESEFFLTLKDVDVHDHSEYTKTKEIYIIEAAKHGIKVNRSGAKLVRSEIISISLMSEIINY